MSDLTGPLEMALASYLVPCFASVLAALVAWQGFRRLREESLWSAIPAFLAVAALQLAMLVSRAANLPVPGSLFYVLDGVSAGLLGWVFVGPARRVFLVVVLAVCSVLGTFSLSLWQLTNLETELVEHSWWVALGVIYGAVALAAWHRRYEQLLTLAAPFALLAAGAGLALAGIETGALAARLLAFPLLPVALLLSSSRDLESARAELRSFSEHALRQTQQLTSLLRASTSLVSQFDAALIFQEAVEGVALGMGADSALIALLADSPNQQMRVQAVYPAGPLPDDGAFLLSSQPAMAEALELNRQVTWVKPQRGIHALATLMNSAAGPGIIQPMVYQERILGTIVALNGRSQRAFTEGEQRVLESFGAQVAAAAENAFLYRQLDSQAHELAKLLAAREEEADRQAAILESIADGVIVSDDQNLVILANAAASRILDIPCEQLLGQRLNAILGQVASGSNGALSKAAARSRDGLHAILQINSRYIQSSVASVQGPNLQHLGLVAVLRDVTAEQAAEQAKSQFIATVSHELRTPLTSVQGYADLLLGGAAGQINDGQRGFVGIIRASAERLTDLVNAVIQFSEMEQGAIEVHPQAVDVGAIVVAATGAFRKKIQARDLTLAVQVAPRLPLALADPERTRQILDQLLDNAIRFTPGGGRIEVQVGAGRLAAAPGSREFVAVVVTDTGVGLTRSDQEHIFERFYRAANPLHVGAGGLGIGLSIARALAEAQSGTLTAMSPGATGDQPGNGSVFTLLLPAAQNDLASSAPAESQNVTRWLEETLSFLDDAEEGKP